MKKKYKSILAVTLFFIIGSLSMLFAVTGDTNDDGTINILDALMIAQYSVGIIPDGFEASAGDVNCSANIDILDALIVAQYYVRLILEFPCTTTPEPTSTPGIVYNSYSTWFTSLGSPYGGCGIPQNELETQYFVALNVQNTPGDYTTFFDRPITGADLSQMGMFNNGLNCGRWVKVVIGDNCNGINDGFAGKDFCRDGAGWITDPYNGAELYMIVADSCQDGNGWCRDDQYHLDLAKDSLNQFEKNGVPVGDMEPHFYNNRKISWEFVEAPGYTGDIKIGFIMGAQEYWSAIAIAHLQNGIHGVDYWDGTSWVKSEMNSDMGQSYIISPIVLPGSDYRIRVYDVNDQLINNGRVYNFSFPESCGTQCSSAFTEISYTVE